MRKRLDDVFAALMLLATVAVSVAGSICPSHSIDRAKAEPAPVQIAPARPETEEALPTPAPEPVLTYHPDIPLAPDIQRALHEVCEEEDVPVALALGVIEVESRFQEGAVSSEGCMGLMQLNPKYFPGELSPADNLREGVRYLGRLLNRYGETGAALTAYNAGHDTGSRTYADAVLSAAERWREVLE